MTYATAETMIARFGERELVQATDNVEPRRATTITMTVLQQAMDIANSEVDAALSSRWAVPVVNPPAMLVQLATDIARYHLAVGSIRTTERDEKRYDIASKKLKQIASGEWNIGLTPAGGKPAPASSNDVVIIARPNDFARGGW